MAFLVTTRRPDADDRNCNCMIPMLEGAGQHSPGCACFKAHVVSRRAVATLEGAREACLTIVQGEGARVRDLMAALEISLSVTESGGTVGPLADGGTTIEVEPVDFTALNEMTIAGTTGVRIPQSQLGYGARIIAAFNAKQATA